jgi:Flp pilus assembly protein CpaB
MAPAPASLPTQSSSGFVTGLVVGVSCSLILLGSCGGLAGYAYVKKKTTDARRGWNLVPVVVAAVDIGEGTVVTFDQISQRSIPEQFVTSSVVKPDSASYIVSQRITVPVQAGDPLLWSQFETRKQTPVLFAARDLPIGAKLSEADVEVAGRPEGHLTPSFVRDADRPQAMGRVLVAPFRKGDPILWTHFKAGP